MIKKYDEKTLKQAFNNLERGNVSGSRILIKYMAEYWWDEVLDRISSRIANRGIFKDTDRIEKLRRSRQLAKLAFLEAGSDMLLRVLKGDISSLDELREQFIITFGYWLLRAEIRDIIK
jgi:hypothetical protein